MGASVRNTKVNVPEKLLNDVFESTRPIISETIIAGLLEIKKRERCSL